jgi:hypothetical protein
MHTPPQLVCPVAQTVVPVWHTPASQTCPEGQSESVVQEVPGMVHTPETQVEPVPQTSPQAPQLEASVDVSTQAPPQLVRPEAHTIVPL